MTPLQRRWLDVAILVAVEAVVYLTLFDLGGSIRWVLALGTVLLLPGAAIVCWLDLRDTATFWALMLVLSIAVTGLGATLLLWMNWRHPLLVTGLLAIACCGALVVDIIRITRTVDRATPLPSTAGWG